VVQAAGSGRFQVAARGAGSTLVELRAVELAMILDGIDVSKLNQLLSEPLSERGDLLTYKSLVYLVH
jgi:hypothetical protein